MMDMNDHRYMPTVKNNNTIPMLRNAAEKKLRPSYVFNDLS